MFMHVLGSVGGIVSRTVDVLLVRGVCICTGRCWHMLYGPNKQGLSSDLRLVQVPQVATSVSWTDHRRAQPVNRKLL